MNRPPALVYLFGNPAVVLVVVASGLLALYQWWAGAITWVGGVVALLAMHGVITANSRLNEYRQWKRAWDALDDHRRPPSRSLWQQSGAKASVLVLLVVAAGSYLAQNQHIPGYRLALGWLILVSAGVVLFGLGRVVVKAARRTGGAKTVDPGAVTICVAGPVMPVPALREAYRALPEHCRKLFRTKRTDLQRTE